MQTAAFVWFMRWITFVVSISMIIIIIIVIIIIIATSLVDQQGSCGFHTVRPLYCLKGEMNSDDFCYLFAQEKACCVSNEVMNGGRVLEREKKKTRKRGRTHNDDVSCTRMTTFHTSELFPLHCFRCNFISAQYLNALWYIIIILYSYDKRLDDVSRTKMTTLTLVLSE